MHKGDFIKIDYIGRIESGEIFDLTNELVAKENNIYNEKMKYKPMPLIVGAGFVIPGLDNALLDMNVGERKTIEVSSKDAFGERKPELVRTVSEKEFANQVEPKPGMIVDFASPSRTTGAASSMRGRIQSVANGRVRIDFNHPLAGKNLKYDIAVIEQITQPEKQVEAIVEFFGLNAACKVSDNVEIETKPLPLQIKERVSSLILDYVKVDDKPIKKVKFTEVFERR